MSAMRGSDVVDLGLDLLPKRVVQVVVAVVVTFVAVTGNAAPVMWYINDKAEAVAEVALDALMPLFTVPTPATPAVLPNPGQ